MFSTCFNTNSPLNPLRADPLIASIIQNENIRQAKTIDLIASENYASPAVLAALSSSLQNKYAEGYPGARYYGGNQYVDELEKTTKDRALSVFQLDKKQWNVNVQALSGSPANFAVYTALVPPKGRIMGLALNDGGHLSHGYFTSKRKVSATSLFWESKPYHVNPKTQLIDYDELESSALSFRPHMIICGASAYPRDIDYQRISKIAHKVGCLVLADISHIAGLISAKLLSSPFPYVDIVTTTTHKTLRGPRGALIFSKNSKYSKKITGKILSKEINNAVFPSLQGGPHMNQIAGISVALQEALTPQFREYQKQILKNSKILANQLQKNNITLVSGGTDNHLILIDLRSKKVGGKKVQYLLEQVGIITNKNAIPGGGVNNGLRIGTPAVTTRGMRENEMIKIADFLSRGIELTAIINKQFPKKQLACKGGKINSLFANAIQQNKEVQQLRDDVFKLTSDPKFATHFFI